MSDTVASSAPSGMTLDRFRARTDAFLFAADRHDPGTLVYLEQGSAKDNRAFARANLMCPEPGCSAPDITTVSRSAGGRRDGYRHRVLPLAGTHAPESVLHRQGKALVTRWAATLENVAEARMEVSLGDGERIADVLLTSRTGNRMAVEIQFASLTVTDWLARTQSYEDMGIPVVWFFGGVGQMSPLTGALRLVHKEVLDKEWPLLWINPVEEAIAWLGHRTKQRLVKPTSAGSGVVRFGTMDDLEVTATGLFPPGFLAARNAGRLERAQAAAQREERMRQIIALNQRRQPVRSSGPVLGANTWAPPPAVRPVVPERERCRRCGLRLDPILWDRGTHLGDDCANPHW